ncbi:MAG: cellulose binding domain-containing protein [Lachnospiraceae bacterium]|nr:cellulose binding domain-containing protein [Lachnospiraceae bacterium]
MNKGFIFGFLTALLIVVVAGGAFLLGRGSVGKENKKVTDSQKVTNAEVNEDTETNVETTVAQDEEFNAQNPELDDLKGFVINQSDEWQEGDNYCYNITVNYTNTGEEKTDDWEFTIEVPKDSEISQYWEADMKIENGKIVVKPKDYNKNIEKDASISFGFILKSKIKYNYKKAGKTMNVFS